MTRTHFGAALVCASLFSSHALAQVPDPAPGRDLAAGCAACHGANGKALGNMPSLAGRDRNELVRLMQDFRSGKRRATVMQQLAKGYTDAQIELLAGYFAAQKSR